MSEKKSRKKVAPEEEKEIRNVVEQARYDCSAVNDPSA